MRLAGVCRTSVNIDVLDTDGLLAAAPDLVQGLDLIAELRAAGLAGGSKR